jgi:preprotein translocase subunit SecY
MISIPIEKISRFLPTVEKPTYKQTLNKKFIWTGIALISYLVLSYIAVYGIAETPQIEALATIQTLLGARFGSLMTLGIGPIVTAGILLQLLTGSKIINWDMSKPENRKKFSTWNKFLAIVLCFVEAGAFVIAGALPVAGGFGLTLFVILQLAAGGIIVVLLDELVTKWGFGSGISLFIVAGVATQIIVHLISPFAMPTGEYVGKLTGFIASIFTGSAGLALVYLIPLIMTFFIFLIVIYAQGIKIDIPISFRALRGFGRTWSMNLFYTSVIPVILAAALLANLQLVGRFTIDSETSCGFLGCYDENGNAISGIVYYLTAPRNFLTNIIKTGVVTTPQIMRVITYTLFMVGACTVFSIFWVSTAGMDSGSVAEQLESSGLQIPGYRPDKRSMEAVLNRYIPALAVIGGIAIGLLASFADFLGVIVSGTGVLLTVMILYNYYERLQTENLEEAHPIIRKIAE